LRSDVAMASLQIGRIEGSLIAQKRAGKTQHVFEELLS